MWESRFQVDLKSKGLKSTYLNTFTQVDLRQNQYLTRSSEPTYWLLLLNLNINV